MIKFTLLLLPHNGMPMKGLQRNDAAMENQSWYPRNNPKNEACRAFERIIHYKLSIFQLKSLPLPPEKEQFLFQTFPTRLKKRLPVKPASRE
jgi:hypothetical protein